MNKIFDERKISTFRDFKELVRSNKLIGRREICIVVDRLELENVVYKAELFDDIRKENKQLKEKIDKAIEYIKEHSEMTNIQIYGIENVLAFRENTTELLEILEANNDI